MIPPGDTYGLTFRDHAPMLGLALLWLAFLGHLLGKAPEPHPDAVTPATTPPDYYAQEKAVLHRLEDTDIETTAEKLDRIRRRDAAARQSRIPAPEFQIPNPP